MIIFYNIDSTTGVSKFGILKISIPKNDIPNFSIPLIDIPKKHSNYRHLEKVYQNLVY
jgi:hypothetical protein